MPIGTGTPCRSTHRGEHEARAGDEEPACRRGATSPQHRRDGFPGSIDTSLETRVNSVDIRVDGKVDDPVGQARRIGTRERQDAHALVRGNEAFDAGQWKKAYPLAHRTCLGGDQGTGVRRRGGARRGGGSAPAGHRGRRSGAIRRANQTAERLAQSRSGHSPLVQALRKPSRWKRSHPF